MTNEALAPHIEAAQPDVEQKERAMGLAKRLKEMTKFLALIIATLGTFESDSSPMVERRRFLDELEAVFPPALIVQLNNLHEEFMTHGKIESTFQYPMKMPKRVKMNDADTIAVLAVINFFAYYMMGGIITSLSL